jgi:hypothetical protein
MNITVISKLQLLFTNFLSELYIKNEEVERCHMTFIFARKRATATLNCWSSLTTDRQCTICIHACILPGHIHAQMLATLDLIKSLVVPGPRSVR